MKYDSRFYIDKVLCDHAFELLLQGQTNSINKGETKN